MKKLNLISCFLITLILTALIVPAYGVEHVYFRIQRTNYSTTGTPGQLGYTLHETGNAYIWENGSWVLYGHYMLSLMRAYGISSNEGYTKITISESGTAPTFNFTLNGHYNFETGNEYGGISSVPEYHDLLPGAYYFSYPVSSDTWEIDIVLPY